MNYHLCGGNLM